MCRDFFSQVFPNIQVHPAVDNRAITSFPIQKHNDCFFSLAQIHRQHGSLVCPVQEQSGCSFEYPKYPAQYRNLQGILDAKLPPLLDYFFEKKISHEIGKDTAMKQIFGLE